MLALDSELPGVVVVEVLLWGGPVLLALRVISVLPRERRRSWWVVVAACVVIVADKILDLQLIAMTQGKWLVRAIDPEVASRGAHQLGRIGLLVALFLAGCAGLWVLVRVDRHLDRAKALSLAGLVGIMAYLGARLVPALAEPLRSYWAGSLIELACCALVWAGLLLARRPGDTDR